jgi:predicted nucleotidyltransferase
MWRQDLQQEYRDAAAAVLDRLKRFRGVRGLALFGSVTKGQAWEGSDIDVLMLVEHLEADWHAFELRQGPWRVHLQVIRERTFEQKAHLLRAAALGELILGARIVHDPKGVMRRTIERKREEAEAFHFTEMLQACARFLSEFRNAQKQLSHGDVDGAFLCTNMAFASLAELELLEGGYAPSRRPLGIFALLPREFAEAYRSLTGGTGGMKERVRLAFCYFDDRVNALVRSLSPGVVHAVRRAGTPLPLEDFGELPEIANTSDEIQYLVETLERHGVIRLRREQANIEGYPLEGLDALLVEVGAR